MFDVWPGQAGRRAAGEFRRARGAAHSHSTTGPTDTALEPRLGIIFVRMKGNFRSFFAFRRLEGKR